MATRAKTPVPMRTIDVPEDAGIIVLEGALDAMDRLHLGGDDGVVSIPHAEIDTESGYPDPDGWAARKPAGDRNGLISAGSKFRPGLASGMAFRLYLAAASERKSGGKAGQWE